MNFRISANFIKNICVATLFLVVATFSVFAQTIGKPTYGYTAACASSGFFKYDVNFNINSISLFTAGNSFILELSDANGSFAAPITVDSSTSITTSPGLLSFNVPSNFVGGEKFKYRIRSTSPALFSQPSDGDLPVYFRAYTSPFTINNNSATAVICDPLLGKKLLVDNPTAPPASLTSLKYKWFRNNVIVTGETTSSLTVFSSGTYYTEIDYGTCTTSGSLSKSQTVTVNASTSGQNVTVSSTNGNIVTTGSPVNLVSSPSVTGFTYQWYLDNVLLTGATSENLTTNLPGIYYLIIDNGICATKSNTITITEFVQPIGTEATIIPNLVSPNNDGENDYWKIPKIYNSGTNTNVVILDSRGKIDFTTDNYINNWPQTAIDFEAINPIYYYIITTSAGETKKGTITIVK